MSQLKRKRIVDWHWWLFDEPNSGNLIVHSCIDDGPIVLRKRYKRMACPRCGKVDEYAAIRRGIDEDVRLRSRKDITLTADGFICITPRVVEFFREHQFRGIDLLPLPNGKHFVVMPAAWARYDTTSGQIQSRDPCQACGRYSEVWIMPSTRALTFPADMPDIVTLDFRFESKHYSDYLWIFGGHVYKLLRASHFSGVGPRFKV